MRTTANQFITVQYQNDITYLFNRDKLNIKSNAGYKINNVTLTILEILPDGTVVNNIARTSYTANNNTVQAEINSLCLSVFERSTLNSALLIKRFAVVVEAYYTSLSDNKSANTDIVIYFSGIWGTLPVNMAIGRNYKTNIYTYNGKVFGAPKILRGNPNASKNEYNLTNILGGDIPPYIPEGTLTVFPSQFGEFENTENSKTISVTSGVPYQIEKEDVSDTWFSIDRMSGSVGTQNLTVSVQKQLQGQPRRSGYIRFISSGSVLLSLQIVQREGVIPTIITNPTTLSKFNNTENSQNLSVTSNVPYEITPLDSWITTTPTLGQQGTQNVSIRVDAQLFNTQERSGVIKFISNGYEVKKMIINQSAGDVVVDRITATTTNFTFEKDAETKSTTVKTNVNYYTTKSADWITTQNPIGIIGNNTYYIGVSSQPAGNPQRKGVIKFFKESTNIQLLEIEVTQKTGEAPVISISPNLIEFDHNGGSQRVGVSSNAYYSFTPDKSWIHVNGTTGEIGTQNITISVDPQNLNTPKRTGNIPFVVNGSVVFNLPVTQKANRGDEPAQINAFPLWLNTFPAERISQTVEITSNIDYEIVSDDFILTSETVGHEGVMNLTITALAMSANGSSRYGAVNLMVNGAMILSLTVIQLGISGQKITLTPPLIPRINENGDSINVSIQNNTSQPADIYIDKVWARFNKGEISTGSNQLTLTVDPMPIDINLRNATISASNGEYIGTFNLTQQRRLNSTSYLSKSINNKTRFVNSPQAEQVYTTDLYKVTVITNTLSQKDIINKTLLRWIDSRGENQCYLFCNNTPTYSIESEKEQTYSDMFDIITYGSDYSINAGRSIKKTTGTQIECFANFIDQTMYDYLREVTTSPVVDYYDFERNLWVSVNVTANQLQKKNELSTLNFIVAIPTYQPQEL